MAKLKVAADGRGRGRSSEEKTLPQSNREAGGKRGGKGMSCLCIFWG